MTYQRANPGHLGQSGLHYALNPAPPRRFPINHSVSLFPYRLTCERPHHIRTDPFSECFTVFVDTDSGIPRLTRTECHQYTLPTTPPRQQTVLCGAVKYRHTSYGHTQGRCCSTLKANCITAPPRSHTTQLPHSDVRLHNCHTRRSNRTTGSS